VQTPDDEQFEAYLKRFHPIAPEPVPTLSGRSSRRSRPLGIWLAAVAAILVIGAVILRNRSSRSVVSNTASHAAERHGPSER